ncbi:MAG: TetR family transcriptional regulator [Actinobacteria bacterium]|jgi:AcrR family transcriptional regulator|nr:TetR family transcriptional regulator [Actinomycetota bacterium]
MLNMGSVEAGPPRAEGEDLTARARIRDAAITCFAEAGVAGTSVRTVAAAASVSPALVIHHFGSKDALRVACDQYVAALVREQKSAAMAQGPGLDPFAALRTYRDGPPLLAYLARTLTDGSPHVAALVDEMVEDAVAYMEQGVEAGMLKPSEDPRGRAAVMTLWSLGALVLHEHAQRLLGADLLGDPLLATAYYLPGLEIMGAGLMTPEVHERMHEQFRQIKEQQS